MRPFLAPNHRKLIPDPRVGVLFAILFAYVLWPVSHVLIESIRVDGRWSLAAWREFLEEGHWILCLRSVGISAATVALAGFVGTALAFFYGRIEFAGRGVFAALTLLPFTLPPLVGVFSIWTLFAEGGLVDRATAAVFGSGFWFEKGYGGVLLVHTYSMFVYFYVMVGGVLAGFDESQIEAARNLGAGRLTVFVRVLLPQLVPALAGASLLAFMTSMASFTAPYFYMSGKPVLTLGIQQALESSRDGLASADCVMLGLCAVVFLLLNSRLERSFLGGRKGVSRRRVRLVSPLIRWGASLLALGVTFCMIAPHLAMAHEAFVKKGTGFVGRPTEYTLENFRVLFTTDDMLNPIGVSLAASSAAMAAVIVFTLFSAWMDARVRFSAKPFARGLVMLPWALPGTVIAVSLLWITRSANPVTLGLELRGTIWILALAYFIRMMPLAHRTIHAALLRTPEELEWAARDLGSGPLRAFLRVTLPLVAGAVLAAATLTFVTSMGEFVSSILLHGPGTEPISVKIDQLRRGPGGIHMAAAYSTLLTLMITATFLLFGRRSEQSLG